MVEGEEMRFWYKRNEEDYEGTEYNYNVLMIYPDNRFTFRKESKSTCEYGGNSSVVETNIDMEGTYTIEGDIIRCIPIKEDISTSSSSTATPELNQNEQTEGEKLPLEFRCNEEMTELNFEGNVMKKAKKGTTNPKKKARKNEE